MSKKIKSLSASTSSVKRFCASQHITFVSKNGFSDQQFLVNIKDFKKQIYNEIRTDSYHFPRGDVFERRVFSFMKNNGWERIIFRHGSYIHENI